MDRSEAFEITEMLRILVNKLDTRPVWKSSHIGDVQPSSTAFVLNKAIHAIEYLDGETEELKENFEHFRALAVSRNEELEKECERSNQLEKELSRLKAQYGETQKVLSGKSRLLEMAKGFLRQRREQISRLEEELRQNMLVRTAQKKVIDEKERHICDLHRELWELQEKVEYWEDLAKKYADPDGCKPNNPCNFCGNCKHFVTHPNDIATCNNKWASPYIVDPDDASCSHFESNQVDRDKPDQPCCKACNRDDCDDCTLCPF